MHFYLENSKGEALSAPGEAERASGDPEPESTQKRGGGPEILRKCEDRL